MQDLLAKHKASDFIPARIMQALKKCSTDTKPMQKAFKYLNSNKTFLVMTGKVGTGKTVAAYWAGLQIMERGITTAYGITITDDMPPFKAIKAFDLIDIAINNQAEFERLKTSYFLVLDELGGESYKNIEYWHSVLDRFFDYRYEHCLKTIIISNLNFTEITKRYPERMIDRLKGDSMVVNITGASLRGASNDTN